MKAAQAILENLRKEKPEELGVILGNIGYSPSIALNPFMVTQSAGFKLALEKLGLTETLITESLVTDIKEKPKNRIQELKLGAEILGMVKRESEPDKPKTQNTYNFIFNNPEAQADIKILEDKIKARLIQPHDIQTN